MRGSDSVAFSNPDAGMRVADEDVKRLWSNWGFVVSVYCPGSRRTLEDPCDSFAPTVLRVSSVITYFDISHILLIFEDP